MELVTTKYKQTEVGLIPEDWQEVRLSSCCCKITDGTHDTPKPTKSGFKFLTAIHVKENRVDYDSSYYLPEEVHRIIYNRCNPEKGDVLMVNIGAGVATTALVDVDYEFSLKNVALLKPSKSKVLGSYINYWQSFTKDSIVKTISTGGAQPFFSLKQIGDLKIALPSIDEQKAIAQVLSDTDKLIQSLEKKIAKKKLIKQGVMQALLTPKEGWEEITLKDYLLESPKYGINAASVAFDHDLPTYLRITDITEDGAFRKHGKVSVDSPFSHLYYLEKGDVVFARTGASTGKSYLYTQADGKLVFAGFLIRVKPNPAKLKSEYLKLYTETKAYWDWVTIMSMRSGQPGINGNEYANLTIPIPKTIEEQEAVCNVLNDINKEIILLTQDAQKYQELKQGMMQQLLTGKIRLV